eukprot:7390235-Prymnesium_polylepis.4
MLTSCNRDTHTHPSVMRGRVLLAETHFVPAHAGRLDPCVRHENARKRQNRTGGSFTIHGTNGGAND